MGRILGSFANPRSAVRDHLLVGESELSRRLLVARSAIPQISGVETPGQATGLDHAGLQEALLGPLAWKRPSGKVARTKLSVEHDGGGRLAGSQTSTTKSPCLPELAEPPDARRTDWPEARSSSAGHSRTLDAEAIGGRVRWACLVSPSPLWQKTKRPWRSPGPCWSGAPGRI